MPARRGVAVHVVSDAVAAQWVLVSIYHTYRHVRIGAHVLYPLDSIGVSAAVAIASSSICSGREGVPEDSS